MVCVYIVHHIYSVEGTGDPIKVSSCHLQTNIKVKFSVFTGSCDDLQCVTGGAEPDFECPLLRRENELGEWDSMASALTFDTKIDQNYYILVQQADGRGTVWLNIENTSVDASVSKVFDYCGGDGVPSLYPGTWFQSKLLLLYSAEIYGIH
jgi:hypothetical protein